MKIIARRYIEVLEVDEISPANVYAKEMYPEPNKLYVIKVQGAQDYKQFVFVTDASGCIAFYDNQNNIQFAELPKPEVVNIAEPSFTKTTIEHKLPISDILKIIAVTQKPELIGNVHLGDT